MAACEGPATTADMTRLVADIESDGLLDTITRVWCIHTLDVDTGEEEGFGPDEILAGLDHLQSADELILHNGIGFDLPALQKVYPHFNTDGIKIFDTLVASRLIQADLETAIFPEGYPRGSFRSACTALTASARGVCGWEWQRANIPIGPPGRPKCPNIVLLIVASHTSCGRR